MPFLRNIAWCLTCLLHRARTSLSCVTLLRVLPACFLERGQALPARLCLESSLLASSAEDKLFVHDSAWSPACLLPQVKGEPLSSHVLASSGRGRAPFFLRGISESHVLASLVKGEPFPSLLDSLKSRVLASSGQGRAPFSFVFSCACFLSRG